MRSLLPKRRHVSRHALIEGALEDAYSHLMAHIGQQISIRWKPGHCCTGDRPHVRTSL
jgi:hypothetical protein